jgi:protein-tyrosine-phosphatase
MKKVMFICTGNICRSAMAQAMLEKKVNDKHKSIVVYSCGIFAETGDFPTYNAIEAMEEYKIDLTKHKATNIRDSEIKDMDLILCATMSHKLNVLNMYPELKEKIYTIKEYADFPENDLDIKDPWGYDIEIYRFCASEIDKCLDIIIEKL